MCVCPWLSLFLQSRGEAEHTGLPVALPWTLRQVPQCLREPLQGVSLHEPQAGAPSWWTGGNWMECGISRFPGSELIPRRCCFKRTFTLVIISSQDSLKGAAPRSPEPEWVYSGVSAAGDWGSREGRLPRGLWQKLQVKAIMTNPRVLKSTMLAEGFNITRWSKGQDNDGGEAGVMREGQSRHAPTEARLCHHGPSGPSALSCKPVWTIKSGLDWLLLSGQPDLKTLDSSSVWPSRWH